MQTTTANAARRYLTARIGEMTSTDTAEVLRCSAIADEAAELLTLTDLDRLDDQANRDAAAVARS